MHGINRANFATTKIIIKKPAVAFGFSAFVNICRFLFHSLHKTYSHLRAGEKVDDILLGDGSDPELFSELFISMFCIRQYFFRHPYLYMAATGDGIDNAG